MEKYELWGYTFPKGEAVDVSRHPDTKALCKKAAALGCFVQSASAAAEMAEPVAEAMAEDSAKAEDEEKPKRRRGRPSKSKG